MPYRLHHSRQRFVCKRTKKLTKKIKKSPKLLVQLFSAQLADNLLNNNSAIQCIEKPSKYGKQFAENSKKRRCSEWRGQWPVVVMVNERSVEWLIIKWRVWGSELIFQATFFQLYSLCTGMASLNGNRFPLTTALICYSFIWSWTEKSMAEKEQAENGASNWCSMVCR